MKAKLIAVSKQNFVERGIKNVSMDEIADALGISKKTLYQIVESKELLLRWVLEDSFIGYYDKFKFIVDNFKGENVFDLLFDLHICGVKYGFQSMPEHFYKEVHKYYPSLCSVFFQELRKKTDEILIEEFFLAQRHGYFLQDLDMHIVYGCMSDILSDRMEYKKGQQYSWKQIHDNILTPYIRGCLTERGREALLKAWENHKDEFQALNV